MRYYFKLSDASDREDAIIEGREPKKIRLYVETDEILKDIDTNPASEWWGVYTAGSFSTEFADFERREDAESAYYEAEGVDIYCRLCDC